MALDVNNHPLSIELHLEQPSAITSDLTDVHHPNLNQISPTRTTKPRQNSSHKPQYYPIFDPPKAKLKKHAQVKAAAMVQYDNNMYAAL